MHKAAGSRARSFHLRYAELCRVHTINPLPNIKGKAGNLYICEVQGDKLSVDDWMIIIDCLQYDCILHTITIRMRKCIGYVMELYDTEAKAKTFKQKPTIYTKFVFAGLINALTTEIKFNKNLKTLNLEALPLNGQWIDSIAKAMCSSNSIKEVSFQHSNIGDNGCDSLCCSIKYTGVIETLNLADCGLTTKSGEHIANMIKIQKIQRLSESWEKTCSYKPLSFDSINCLNNIVLAQNPWLCDDGAKMIIEALKDDVCIRHVNMQDCNLTNSSAILILELIKVNRNIQSFDINGNNNIDTKLLDKVNQCFENDDQLVDVANSENNEKANLAELSEELNGLEKRFGIECDLRKKAEQLSQDLNLQVLSMESKFQMVVPTDKIPDGFVVVNNKILESVIEERNNLQELTETICSSRTNTPRLVLNTFGEKKHFVRLETESPMSSKSLPLQSVGRNFTGLESKLMSAGGLYVNHNRPFGHSDFGSQSNKKTPRLLQIYTKKSIKPTDVYVETGIGDTLDNVPMTSQQATLLMSPNYSANNLLMPNHQILQTEENSEEDNFETVSSHSLVNESMKSVVAIMSDDVFECNTKKKHHSVAPINSGIDDQLENMTTPQRQSNSIIFHKNNTNLSFSNTQPAQNNAIDSNESDFDAATATSSHSISSRSIIDEQPLSIYFGIEDEKNAGNNKS